MAVKTDVKLSNVSYLILYVKDTETALPFYRDILGMKVKASHPGWVELDAGRLTLALHSKENLPDNRDGQPEIVFSVVDIYDTYEKLKSHGIKFVHEPKQVCEEGDQLGISAKFHDPDRNLLSIFSMVKKK